MQKNNNDVSNKLKELVSEVESEFIGIQGGGFVYLATGELFTKVEHDKYLQRKIENYKVDIFATINNISETELGIENDQRLINKKSQTKNKKGKKSKATYDGGEFNMVYRNKIMEVLGMKLTTNERLVFYVLRDLIQYPTNCVVINEHIPTTKELEPLIGLTEKSILNALKSLEEKNLLKRKQYGRRKSIFVNPEYYASGKDLDIETLKLFNLVECDDEKIDSYL